MPLLFKRSLLPKLRSFPLSADAVSILSGAAEFRRCLLEKIATATQRIYIVALYLQQDEAGQEILDALHAAKAARPELDIVVVVDWLRAQRGLIGAGKQPGNSAWYQQMTRDHASEVPIYGVPVQTRELFGVLHLKGFVIDDSVLYSGASLNNVYLHKFDKYRFDRYHLLHNRALADSMQHLIEHGLVASKAVHRLDLPNLPTTRSLRNDIGDLRSRLKYAAYDTSAGSTAHTGLSVSPLLGVGKNNRGGDSIFLANSIQYSDFNGPGEKSVQARYDLKMAEYGVPGLSFMTRYVKGWDIDGTGLAANSVYRKSNGDPLYGADGKHNETNFEAKYVVQTGPAKDLSFRIRQAWHQANADQGEGDIKEFRLIVDYPLSIL